MTIASEISRLQGVKSDILTAIADKGVTVPSGAMLDDCPELIAAISGGSRSSIVLPTASYQSNTKLYEISEGVLTTKVDNASFEIGDSYDLSGYESLTFHTKFIAKAKLNGSYCTLFGRQKSEQKDIITLSYYSGTHFDEWGLSCFGGYSNGAGFTNFNLNSFSQSWTELEVSLIGYRQIVKINGTVVKDYGYSPNKGVSSLTFGRNTGNECNYLKTDSKIDLNETYLIADGQYLFGSDK